MIAPTTSGRNRSAVASNRSVPRADAWRNTRSSLAGVVAACQQGDRNAQRQLYERCCEQVFRLVNRMVGSQDAPDLVQEVFLKVFRTIEQFAGHSRFETWLYRVATNECLQFLRKARRQSCKSLSIDPADCHPGHALNILERDLVAQALARLEPELRCIFLLREVEGLSYEKVAAALAIPQGTVGSRLNRARAELKLHLLELGWEF